MKYLSHLLTFAAIVFLVACSDDNHSAEADRLGVAAECTQDSDCADNQECILDFKGGYCGITECTTNSECPESSICVTHDNQINYCFRTCLEKTDCNVNRSTENEANCSGSFNYAEEGNEGFDSKELGYKACVPPSGATTKI